MNANFKGGDVMKRIIALVLSVVCVIGLVGCNDPASNNQENLCSVYSFTGENEQLEISNGVIVLSKTEEVFDGGDLEVMQEELHLDVVSYSTTFYTMMNGEKKIILSNSVIDETGGSVNVEGDLGRASGDGFIIGNKVESIDEVKENLWFELKIKTLNGEENVYQLQLELTEITS